MPLLNDTGDPMPKRSLTIEELANIVWLRSLEYPKDEKKIFHLDPSDFRIWIYQLNPRDSLLLSSTSGISERIRDQMYPSSWKQIKDFFWRIVH